jgi:4-hydroxyphenylacetate 3-monooxygenase
VRTGSEYRDALHDGRRVWVVGEGLIEDVTLHPATRPMVDEYVAWYDRHHDPEWRDVLLAPAAGGGPRAPWAFTLPRTSADLRAMGRSYAETIFLTAGNMTHTPATGNLIALGISTWSAAQCLPAADRRRRRVPRPDRPHRPRPDLLGGRRHHRLPAPRGRR